MADTFQLITGLPEDRPKVYNLAGKTTDEAMKMLRYLKRNAFFGTHTGLPKEIRNSKINESLISNIGDYSVIDVFAYPQTSCIIGTVVNFHISDDVNTLGSTYVYPCTDKDKPMGYMISDATPDKLGVCLVHGVIEVPLYYFSGSVEEKTDYVEYDLDNKCFKFANSGYPVFNVYQDVDGDWIAIILFGDIASDYEYDGPFAVSVAGITGSTMYVNSLGGSVFYNDINGACADLEISVPLSTGESLWLETTIVGDTHSYQFMPLSTIPVDGNTTFYTKIAENNEGKLRQIHYGNIRYSRTKIISGSTNVHIYPSNGLGDVTISVDQTIIPRSEFYVPDYTSLEILGDTVPDGLGHTFILPVKAGTVCMWDEGGGAKAVYTDIDGAISITLNNKEETIVPYDGWVRVSVIDGGTASNECLSLDTSTGHIALYKYGTFGDKNIEYKEGVGISITDETISVTNEEVEGEIVPVEVLTGNKIISLDADLTATLENDVAFISITGSTSPVKLIKGSGITFTDGSSENEIIIGATFAQIVQDLTLDVDDNTATIGLTESSSQVSITGGTNISIVAGGDGEFVINCTVVGNTGSVTGITSSVGVNNATVSLIGGDGSVVFVGDGLTTISTNANDEIVIGSTFTETPQDLTLDIDNYVATIGLTESSSQVSITGGTNILVHEGDDGEIVIDCTVVGNTGSVTGLTHSVNTNSATVSTVGGFGDVVFVGSGLTTISTNENDAIVIGSTFTETPQDLTLDISDANSAIIGLTDSGSTINVIGEGSVTINEGANGELVVSGSTFTETPQDLTVSLSEGGIATIGLTYSSSKVNFEGMGSVYLTQIRSSAGITERESWGRRYNPDTGEEDGELKNAGWRGIIPLKIFDDNVPDDMVMTEISMYDAMEVDGSTVNVLYPLIVPDTTDEELGIIARCTLNELAYPDEILEKAYAWAETRVNQGKSPFYDGDASDESLRNIPNSDTIIVYGVVPSLMSHVVDDNVAVLEIAGSTSYVLVEAGEGLFLTAGQDANSFVFNSLITIEIDGSTGGGGGGEPALTLLTPNYSSLAITGGTVPEGLGHTFVLPVKAGTVGFFDDGLGAVGVWTDVTGASIERLTNRTVYDAPCDGWIRISVIDGGTSSGSCLSIQDVTGNLPIYKYGSFASLSAYNGPFKVTRVPDANVNDFDTTFDVFISDGLGRNQNYAGYIVDGESARIPVDASNVVSHSGDEIYLIQSGGTYSFVSVSSYSALPSCDFATLIAKMTNVTSGGSALFSEPIQIQRADIVAPPRQISCSVYSDDYALIELTGSTSSVKLIKGNGIVLSEGSNANELVLGATFTETLQDLNVDISYGVASISITGGHNTVKLAEGTNITITEGEDGEVVIGSTFTEIPQDLSSFVGDTGTATVSLSGSTNTIKIIQGDNITITAGEGDNEIILGSTVTGTVTGLTSSVNINSATVSTIGGIGDVVFVGEGLTTVSTNSSNAIVLSTSYTETPQDLTLDIDNYVATIGLTESSSQVSITGGTNILVHEGDDGEIVIDCTVVGNTGSVTGITSTVGVNDATVSLIGGSGSVVFVGSGLTTISTNENNEIVLDTTFTETPQDLSVSTANGIATISLSSSSDVVKVKKGSNIFISSDGSDAFVIGSTYSENMEYRGAFFVSGSTNSENVFIANCYDAQGRESNVAGYVIKGDTRIPVAAKTNFAMIDGTRVYLLGISGTTSYQIVAYSGNTMPEDDEGWTDDMFYTQIAYKANGVIYQTQYGDVFLPDIEQQDASYDGPFAVKVDHVDETTPTTLYVTVNAGVITYEKNRKDVSAVTTSTSLSSGQSYWLKYDTVNDTFSRYKASSPQADSNNVIQVKLAENVNGVLKQVQFGEIILSKPNLTWEYNTNTHIVNLGITGSTKSITMYGKNGIVLSNDNTSNTIAIYLSGTIGTVTGITSSVVSNSATISLVGGSGKVNLVGVGGTTVAQGISDTILIDSIIYKEGTGISIDDEIDSDTNLLTGDKIISLDAELSSSLTNPNEASVYITGSTVPVKFKAGEGIVVSAGQNSNEVVISSVITIDADGSGGGGSGGLDTLSVSVMNGTASIYITGTTEYVKLIKGSGVTITEGSNSNEVVIGSTVSGNTGTVTGVSYSVGLNNTATISTVGGSGKVRFVGDGVDITETSSNEIKLAVTGGSQDLSASVSGGTAFIGLSGSTNIIKIRGGSNTSITGDTANEIIVGSTINVSGSVGFPDYTHPITKIEFGNEYGPYDYDVWIIGSCGIYMGKDASITLYLGGRAITLYDYHGANDITNYVSVCIPLSSNEDRAIHVEGDSDMDLYIYPCI